MNRTSASTDLYVAAGGLRYGFGDDHPFGPDRYEAFLSELEATGLDAKVSLVEAQPATRQELELFHARRYIDWVAERSAVGTGWLDGGDTPVFPGIFEQGAAVVGVTLAAARALMRGLCSKAFAPIAGLHHARRDGAAGFCVFNDCGVAIEMLRREFGLTRIAYVDIDAHHGDGVFYGFEDDPGVVFADIHEDGRFLYPGSGHADETGRGRAAGSKLNLPVPPGAGDAEFLAAWARIEPFIEQARPEFILFQCGADSIAGDPLTHLRFSPAAHAHAAARLCALASSCCAGRLLGMGGGGYNRRNLALAWTGVVNAFVESAD
jgi:acetoin utilization protein AcuC